MILTNTPEHIRKLQNQMMRNKTPEERGRMAMEMYEMAILAVKNRLHAKYPNMPEAQLKGEIFRCINKGKFPPEKMDKIVAHLVDYHTKNPSTQG